MNNRQDRLLSGFTLIELMIVVSIIGILAAIAIPKFADLVRKAKEGAVKGDLGEIRSALSIYYSDMEGFYPSYCSMGTQQTNFLNSVLTVNGKYLTSLPAPPVPDYHSANPVAGVVYKDTGNCNDASLSSIAAFSNGGLLGDPAGMFPWTPWAYLADPNYPGTWGQVVVGCTHTDSKGTLWTNY